MLRRPRRHDIGMAGKHHDRRSAAVGSPEVVDLTKGKVVHREPEPCQVLTEQCLTAGVFWCHAGALHERNGQIKYRILSSWHGATVWLVVSVELLVKFNSLPVGSALNPASSTIANKQHIRCASEFPRFALANLLAMLV